MTLFHRLVIGSAIAALAVPGFSSTIKHRAVAPPSAPAIAVTGIIRDSVTNLPIAGADVVANGAKSPLTGADGRSTITVARGGSVLLTAEHFAYTSQSKSVTAASGATADFTLTPH